MSGWLWWVVAFGVVLVMVGVFAPQKGRNSGGTAPAARSSAAAAPRAPRAGRDVIDLPEDGGAFDYEVVGESNYQAQLERIAGRSPDGVRLQVGALLVPEPDNPHDPNAVRVVISGATVGYIPREDARAFSSLLRGRKGRCLALIVGGWDRGAGGRGHFGVRLDIESPDDD